MTSGYLSHMGLAILLKYKTYPSTHHAYNFVNLSIERLQCKNLLHKGKTQLRNKAKNKQTFLFLYLLLPDVSTTIIESL